ncbi:MAG: hypothetical protein EOQ52_07000 [Mesorhizobium sp.]|uniref:hypothetical protein n=1 Tax=Mesorhizobium sp. TaxID=1871066 RepID=UPI000FE528C4|nr:hypothetical protein [Mesorhizobium sp.]RWB91167.1 MAG: hypothetical protein EOQ52_07000 [Mesorhizobium sp.]
MVFLIAEVTLGTTLSAANAEEVTNLLSYGTEAGMSVTITGRSGIDTDHAQLTLKLTPQDAKLYCTQSRLNSSLLECIDRTLKDVKLQPQISANCESGEFTNVWGRHFTFNGAAADGDDEYNLEALGGDTSEERSTNYDVAIDNFKAMCPSRIAQANANASAVSANEPEPGSAAQDVPSPPALQNFANQSSSDPRISQMTCSVRGTAILGVPNMGSEDPENEVEVGLTSAGDFIVEGKQIAAVDVVRNGGTITFSMISVEDYLLAGSKDATGASMGLSDDENMQFQAMQKMFLGGALHSRKRFAIYDVANSRLAFADADGQQFKNITEARCMAN